MPSTAAKRAEVNTRLVELIDAITSHELWTPTPNPSLYHVWDFVNRSKYFLSEYNNVKNGTPLQHPEQFKPAPGTGLQAAEAVYQDVCGRSMLAKMIITDTTGKAAAMMGGGGPAVDFGRECKDKVEALNQASK